MQNMLSLQSIAGGALQEKADVAMQKVLENMQDPNTPWKNKRVINIKIAFSQNEERDDTAVEVSVDTKLAPVSPMVTRMAIGKNLDSGRIVAEEYGNQIKGQLSFADLEAAASVQKIGNDVVNVSTGEVIGNDKVVDLRKAAAL